MWFGVGSCLVVAGLLAGTAAQSTSKRKKKDDDSNKVQMMRHSFVTPLSYDNNLDEWMLSGASISIRDRVLLNPGVPERHGFFFNKAPLLTNDYEVSFTFRVVGDKEAPEKSDQSFGFFYVYENVTQGHDESKIIKAKDWKEGMKDVGLTFSGFKSKFDGYGVVFSTMDAQKKPKPSISGVLNDGTQSIEMFKGVPTSDAKPVDFRNTLNAAQMKIRATPTTVEGWLKLSPSLSWIDCFKLTGTFKSGGYLGFTSWSGEEAGPKTDMVSIVEMNTYNHDTTSLGEDIKDVSKEIQDAYREMLTDKNRHFKDQKSQKEHLERLTEMLSNHMIAVKPQEDQMFKKLTGLQDRMHRLEENCKTLRQEIRVVLGNSSSGSMTAMKSELVGLRHVFMKDSAAHSQKIDTVQQTVFDVKKKKEDKKVSPQSLAIIAEKTESLQKTVEASSSQVSWMMIILIIAVVGIGALMYNRMRYYEKKHFI